MVSRLNEMENEGLIVIGRAVGDEFDSHEKIEALAKTVDAWATEHSVPLALVYCGTTINWPDDVGFTPIVIGLVTFSGYGDDDEPVAGEVGPKAMDVGRAAEIPSGFWEAVEREHGVELEGEVDVLLAVAGWTWVGLDRGEDDVCGVSAEDDGFCVVPAELRSESFVVKVGYC